MMEAKKALEEIAGANLKEELGKKANADEVEAALANLSALLAALRTEYVTVCRRAATTATPPPASLLLCARRPCTPPLLL